MKKIKEKYKEFKKKLTTQNIVITLGSIIIIGGALHLGGWNYLKEVFSSRAGGIAAEEGEAEKDTTKFESPDQCQRLYPWGPPQIKDKTVNERSLYICRKSYTIQYDTKLKLPLWEVEILKKSNMSAFNIPSKMGPILDPDLPKKIQATFNSYINSGYNFGYLAPVENMFMNNKSLKPEELEKENYTSLNESFYMSNAIPEARSASIIKKLIDIKARNLVMEKDPLYLVSGPVFLNGKTNGFIGQGKDQIAIPTHIFKIITYPISHGSIAYLIPNNNDFNCGHTCTPEDFTVPIKEVERVTGIEFYSKLDPFYAVQVKQDINELFKKKN